MNFDQILSKNRFPLLGKSKLKGGTKNSADAAKNTPDGVGFSTGVYEWDSQRVLLNYYIIIRKLLEFFYIFDKQSLFFQ